MEKTKIILVTGFSLLSFIVFTGHLDVSFAHTSKTFGNTTLEVGWLSEPPLVSDLNSITLQVSKGVSGNQTSVLNALSNVSSSVKFGTMTKPLDFQPSPTTDGAYEAKIIPTRVGPYSVLLQGDVKGQKVDSEFKIEDIESKGIFSFPDSSIDTTNTNNLNEQVQNVISGLSNDVQNSRDDLNTSQKQMTDIQQSINGLQKNLDSSYLILITALGIGIAAIVMVAYLLNILRLKKGMLERT
ncbi:MAG TPA: hypothetical protein VFH19_01260 [Nitrososphaeraceae archaeon]|nr:hypothetical protein [Nitrososphaeraceae archaeon]